MVEERGSDRAAEGQAETSPEVADRTVLLGVRTRALVEALDFWRKVAEDNGWGDVERTLTVWVNPDGTIDDSVAVRTNSDSVPEGERVAGRVYLLPAIEEGDDDA